jgi:hypothetical protein
MHDPEQEHTPAIGDRVHLNSGSPELEVIAVSDDGAEVTVAWQSKMILPTACVS